MLCLAVLTAVDKTFLGRSVSEQQDILKYANTLS